MDGWVSGRGRAAGTKVEWSTRLDGRLDVEAVEEVAAKDQ